MADEYVNGPARHTRTALLYGLVKHAPLPASSPVTVVWLAKSHVPSKVRSLIHKRACRQPASAAIWTDIENPLHRRSPALLVNGAL